MERKMTTTPFLSSRRPAKKRSLARDASARLLLTVSIKTLSKTTTLNTMIASPWQSTIGRETDIYYSWTKQGLTSKQTRAARDLKRHLKQKQARQASTSQDERPLNFQIAYSSVNTTRPQGLSSRSHRSLNTQYNLPRHLGITPNHLALA